MIFRQFLRRFLVANHRFVPLESFWVGRLNSVLHSTVCGVGPSNFSTGFANHLVQHRFFSSQSDGSNVFELGSEDEFDERVLQAQQPVMVQFYADWCGPCQNLAPRIEAKVNGQNGEVLLARINVDSSLGFLTAQFDVTSVPTVVCFHNGDVIHRFEGDVDDSYLDEIIAHLKEGDSENDKEIV
ncbi:hypothetical protein niasHS_006714 [Heterodera schachtii]|uniref:Thioredoxin domain-containing protein n=1 Tax=Heterodera schachtii TaxID=97005 RepID=A0ABD2JIB3_HETSC